MLPIIQQRYRDSIFVECRSRYGISEENILALGGFDSFVYEFQKQDQLYILKVSHSERRTENELLGEVDWLQYAAKEGVPVCRAIPSAQGNVVEVVGSSDSYFTAVAYEKAPGHLPTMENWNAAFFEEWGRITGKLHSLGKSYQPSNFTWKRKAWDEEEHVNVQRTIPVDQELVIKKSTELLSRLKSIPRTKDSYGIVHGDLHYLNFHIHDSSLTLFDFDDSAYHYFAYDIAVILFYAYWRPLQEEADRQHFIQEFLTSFLTGYQRENEFLDEWFGYLPDFLKLRHLVQYIVFLQSIGGNPRTEEDLQTMEHLRRVIEQDWPIINADFTAMAKRGV